MVGEEKNLAASIAAARKQAGLTQQKLCQVADISYSTLAKIERGAIKSPSVFTISQISKAVNKTVDDLIGASQTAKASKKTSKTGIKFVYFDINGCLVHFYHRAFTAIGDDSGVSPDVIESTFWHYNDLVCRGDMSLAEFNRILGKHVELSEFDWAEYYFNAIEPVKEAVELLQWTSEHYQVGLLSNIMPGFIDRMLNEKILPRINYGAIIDSSKTGYVKPEIDIYELAQTKTGVKSEEILFIDDSRANLMTSGKLKWHGMWFNDYRPTESVKKVKEALEF